MKKQRKKVWTPCWNCKGKKTHTPAGSRERIPCGYCSIYGEPQGGHWSNLQLFLAIGGPKNGKSILDDDESYFRFNACVARRRDRDAPSAILIHKSLFR